ncbi:hypothetical protein WISP_127772 [Willisornis vidua]|uniref:Uncharacterized protein n=1 Tax=Willisornis vidua TaxID=1566151 RepID=A0ABQ9CQH0_9PASS|nr:hypothetical protein WISP_127772 [Willisornis vidua]
MGKEVDCFHFIVLILFYINPNSHITLNRTSPMIQQCALVAKKSSDILGSSIRKSIASRLWQKGKNKEHILIADPLLKLSGFANEDLGRLYRCGCILRACTVKCLPDTRSGQISKAEQGQPWLVLEWESSWEMPGAVGSSPEDFTVTVQAHSTVADGPQDLNGGASTAHAVPHLKNPLHRLEGHTHVGRALPKSSLTKLSHDGDDGMPGQVKPMLISEEGKMEF